MDFNHTPVLFEECMEGLRIKEGGIYADGTLGGGGHAAGIASRIGPEGTLIGIDRDQDALDAAKKHLAGYPCRKIFAHCPHRPFAGLSQMIYHRFLPERSALYPYCHTHDKEDHGKSHHDGDQNQP